MIGVSREAWERRADPLVVVVDGVLDPERCGGRVPLVTQGCAATLLEADHFGSGIVWSDEFYLEQVGTCRIEAVVPIVHVDADDPRHDAHHLCVFGDEVELYDAHGDCGSVVDLGPNPAQHVGKWAVICRDVELGVTEGGWQ